MKIFKWFWDNIFFVATLFLLAFIPLYPKLPLLDVKNTWVYVRAEDFVVVLVLIIWALQLFRKKITLRTPLTLPIIIFWIIGGIATIHAMLLIFPTAANVFPNVAFLSFLRRIEYISLFFIAYTGMKDKRFLFYIIVILSVTLLVVVGYGIGQKYFGFPAYLTMNEEFAKGLPILLSPLSRVPSTFGGHYDLAAYLVLVIPIFASLFFGFRNWLVRLFFLATVLLGFILLFMTVSRVSFFALLIALLGVLLFQKKRLVIFSLPLIAIVLAFLFLRFSPSLLDRFENTVKEVDVLIDASTGEAIGHTRVVSSSKFENKIIKRLSLQRREQLDAVTGFEEEEKAGSQSAIVPFISLPPRVVIVAPPNTPTGENLPQGTGYINLSLSPVVKRIGEFFYEVPEKNSDATRAAVYMFQGNFLIKRASAYDLSATTRLQGEWPRAVEALKRNILVGSGYASISLAVDNNYLRILGEIGILGFISYLAIFVTIGIYIKKVLPEVDSPVAKSFVIGFAAGVVGLALNAILIDVFEASKIAYLLWLLAGVTLGTLSLYHKKYVSLFHEFRKVVTSTQAIIIYLFILTVVLFSPMVNNYFVGDDFTWFRWVADCSKNAHTQTCPSVLGTVFRYFTQADGFFYRPGTKVFFLFMYSIFWLNQAVYHMVSISLHFIVVTLLFLLAKKILRNSLLSALAAFLFLILSGFSEAVFWISSIGFLFNAMFMLASILFYILWEEKKKISFLIASVVSIIFGLLFHEVGVVSPLLLVLYKSVKQDKIRLNMFKKIDYLLLFLPVPLYLSVRFLAQSHWFSGDYNYNLLKLPFNITGNAIGYFFLTLFGPIALPFYTMLRNLTRENILVTIPITVGVISILFLGFRFLVKRLDKDERRIVVFGALFSFIVLLPFLGLGNITSRYSYLASMGIIILFAFFIKKLYYYLLSQGRDIALAGSALVVTVFCLLHIMQVQQIHSDWYEAGQKAKRFVVAVDGLYSDYWSKEPIEFHFVNVPIRVGEAWVFPVGLQDALWFSFQNPNIKVYQWPTVKAAHDAVDGSYNKKVFEFDESGKIIERRKKIPLQ